MRIYLGYFFCFILFSISSSAQRNSTYSGLLLEKASNYTGNNFKGSVKTVYLKAYAINKSLTDIERSDFMMNNDVRGHKYVRFDHYGRIEETLGTSFVESYISAVNKNKSKEYKYDESDWNEKSKQEIKLKQYYPISNHNLLIKVNKIQVPKDTVIIGDKVWEEYSEDIYKYIYNQKGQILEEQEYIFYRAAPVIESKIPLSDDLFTRKLFFYNDRDQVVNQKILGGHFSQKMAYTDMGTQSNFCKDLELKYTYDSKGRILQIIMYGCGEIKAKEDYAYHPIEDYVKEVRCYITGLGGIANPTKSFKMTYNEEGDIIKKEFIPDNPEQKLKQKVRYYTYEYDIHNNWIKCSMYLEGTKEGEPTLVAERKIEYYY